MKKYHPQFAPTLISDWNRNAPQDTSSVATQRTKGVRTTSYDTTSPNENTTQLVSLENDENKSTNNDTTEFISLVNDNKRSANSNAKEIELDPKRVRIEWIKCINDALTR